MSTSEHLPSFLYCTLILHLRTSQLLKFLGILSSFLDNHGCTTMAACQHRYLSNVPSSKHLFGSKNNPIALSLFFYDYVRSMPTSDARLDHAASIMLKYHIKSYSLFWTGFVHKIWSDLSVVEIYVFVFFSLRRRLLPIIFSSVMKMKMQTPHLHGHLKSWLVLHILSMIKLPEKHTLYWIWQTLCKPRSRYFLKVNA